MQSRSGSSLAGVVSGFAVGAITAGATAYYFLQVGQTGGCKRAKTEVVEEPQMKTPLKLKSFENRWTTDSNPVDRPLQTCCTSNSSALREMICTLFS